MIRVLAVAALALALEWTRVLAARRPELQTVALIGGGAALTLTGCWRPRQLGLSRRRLGLKLAGGLGLAAVLVLPAAMRSGSLPVLPPSMAAAAILVSVGEEVAFRGALYSALEAAAGAPAAIVGSTLTFTAAHVLSHPLAFLVPLAAAGLLMGLWRWACRDLVAPILGHTLADLSL